MRTPCAPCSMSRSNSRLTPKPAACAVLCRAVPCCAADKDHFAELAVTAIMRLKGTGNLESIHIIKKPGGALKVSVCVLYAVRMLPQQLDCCAVLHW